MPTCASGGLPIYRVDCVDKFKPGHATPTSDVKSFDDVEQTNHRSIGVACALSNDLASVAGTHAPAPCSKPTSPVQER